MDRCTGCHNITEILLKTALNTIQSISRFKESLDHKLNLALKLKIVIGEVANIMDKLQIIFIAFFR